MECFDNYYRTNNIKVNIKKHTGGGNLKFKYKGQEIKLKKYIDDDNDIEIYLKTIDKQDNCIVITIMNKSKIAYIKKINSNFGKCLKGNLLDNNGTTYIKICIELLKKYKEDFKINKILLSDDAEFYCDKLTSIKLSNLSFLQHRESFYGRFGFVPEKIIDKEYYELNKKILKDIKTKDMNLNLLLNDYKRKNKLHKILINKINNLYIKYKDKKFHKWFNKISRILSNENCDLLAYLVRKLFVELKLYPIDNILYIYEL